MKDIQLKISGLFFLFMAVIHLVRLVAQISVTVAGHLVPMWTSGVAALILLALALWILKPNCCK